LHDTLSRFVGFIIGGVGLGAGGVIEPSVGEWARLGGFRG